MLIIHTVPDIQQQLKVACEQHLSIGFVPTMGALHDGHLALVHESRQRCGFTAVSIFVNPTQFNNPDDFKRYPRTLEEDCKRLLDAGANAIFAPSEKGIYPEPDTRTFNFGSLETVMEGRFRPGHFNGVAQVVSRLFEIIRPDYAFFGEKDFQQLTIIRNLVQQMDNAPEIIACPTTREPDGLAMSSRNLLLTPAQRAHAPLIYATLSEAKKKAGTMPVEEVRKWVIDTINHDAELDVEYAEIVNSQTLQPIKKWDECADKRLCVAVYARPVRLIDNIAL